MFTIKKKKKILFIPVISVIKSLMYLDYRLK